MLNTRSKSYIRLGSGTNLGTDDNMATEGNNVMLPMNYLQTNFGTI